MPGKLQRCFSGTQELNPNSKKPIHKNLTLNPKHTNLNYTPNPKLS